MQFALIVLVALGMVPVLVIRTTFQVVEIVFEIRQSGDGGGFGVRRYSHAKIGDKDGRARLPLARLGLGAQHVVVGVGLEQFGRPIHTAGEHHIGALVNLQGSGLRRNEVVRGLVNED